MTALRIIVNQYYLYENNLVKVVGAKGMENADTMRYLIQWGDSQGRACSAEVTRRELSTAPTIERLYHDYRMALDAICNQANRIEELEAAPSRFRDVMTASAKYVTRFGGEMDVEGAIEKMREEWDEMHKEIGHIQSDEGRPISLRLKTPHRLKRDLAHEAIDLLVTVGGVLNALGVSIEMIEAAADETLAKLDSRTSEQYAWYPDLKQVIKKSKMEAES